MDIPTPYGALDDESFGEEEDYGSSDDELSEINVNGNGFQPNINLPTTGRFNSIINVVNESTSTSSNLTESEKNEIREIIQELENINDMTRVSIHLLMNDTIPFVRRIKKMNELYNMIGVNQYEIDELKNKIGES